MSERLKSLRRILKVQDAVKRMADWRLAEAEQARAEAAEARAALSGFMADQLLVGALATAAATQAVRLDLREAVAAGGVEAAAESVRDATSRQKLAGRALAALTREDRAAQERKDLERLIEGFAGRGMAEGDG